MFVLSGELTAAASLMDEMQALMEVTHSSIAPYPALGLAVLRGRQGEASTLIETATRDAVRRGEGTGIAMVE
jgi:hypothetical protein